MTYQFPDGRGPFIFHADTVSTMNHLPALATTLCSWPVLITFFPQQTVQYIGFLTDTRRVKFRVYSQVF